MPQEKEPFQLQIQQIDNGFVIQTPGITNNNQIVKDPRSFYAPDCDGVCQYLQSIWPRERSIVSLK